MKKNTRLTLTLFFCCSGGGTWHPLFVTTSAPHSVYVYNMFVWFLEIESNKDKTWLLFLRKDCARKRL